MHTDACFVFYFTCIKLIVQPHRTPVGPLLDSCQRKHCYVKCQNLSWNAFHCILDFRWELETCSTHTEAEQVWTVKLNEAIKPMIPKTHKGSIYFQKRLRYRNVKCLHLYQYFYLPHCLCVRLWLRKSEGDFVNVNVRELECVGVNVCVRERLIESSCKNRFALPLAGLDNSGRLFLFVCYFFLSLVDNFLTISFLLSLTLSPHAGTSLLCTLILSWFHDLSLNYKINLTIT